MKYLNMKFIKFTSITLLFSCSTINYKGTNSKIIQQQETIIIRNDFHKYFENCIVEGSIVIYDNNKRQWIVSDTVGTRKETLPASTFKIINLLVALETKTIETEHDIVKWVGSTDTIKYGYRPEIYHDMTVKNAFDVSAGWVFIELAKKIGKEKYKKYLTLCNYGNLKLSQKEDDFWNFGDFAISPINQVEFLKKLYEGKLPFSKRSMDIVKKTLISEQKEDYTIRAKTGWTREGGINTGWWIGYLEKKEGVYFFATRLLQDRRLNSPSFGNCRKDITKSVFKDLTFLK